MNNLTPTAASVINRWQDVTLGLAESYITALDTAKNLIIINSDLLELDNETTLSIVKQLANLQEDIIKLSNVRMEIVAIREDETTTPKNNG